MKGKMPGWRIVSFLLLRELFVHILNVSVLGPGSNLMGVLSIVRLYYICLITDMIMRLLPLDVAAAMLGQQSGTLGIR